MAEQQALRGKLDDVVVGIVRHALVQSFLLSNFSANVTAPGSGAMGMHAH